MFKIRASAANTIMTSNRAGTDIGETVKTYLSNWYKSKLYNRDKTFTSKHTSKGTHAEDQSLDLLSSKFGLLIKNTENLKNDHFTGTPDVITSEYVLDVKTSWDCFTFPLFDSEPNKMYVDQLQVYMDLAGKDKAYLCYCLIDTPEHIIESEARKVQWDRGLDDLEMDLYDEVKALHTYSDITDEQLRVKVFEIKRDQDRIDAIKARVILCREYIARELEPIKTFRIHDQNITIYDTLPG